MSPVRAELVRERQKAAGSAEFAYVRAYGAGDPANRIDWSARARTGLLQSRVFTEDRPICWAAVVDPSASMAAGRMQPLSSAAQRLTAAWFAAAEPGDVQRRVDSVSGLFTLPRGAAVLFVGDCWEMPAAFQELCALGAMHDCTALVACDPWRDELGLRGFVRIADAESSRAATLFVGSRERRRYREAALRREREVCARFCAAGWRCGPFEEDDGEPALLRAFGLW